MYIGMFLVAVSYPPELLNMRPASLNPDDVTLLCCIPTVTTAGALFHIDPQFRFTDYDLECFLSKVITMSTCLTDNPGLHDMYTTS